MLFSLCKLMMKIRVYAVVSSAAPTELAVISVMSCDDPKEEEIVATGEEPAKTQEGEMLHSVLAYSIIYPSLLYLYQ